MAKKPGMSASIRSTIGARFGPRRSVSLLTSVALVAIAVFASACVARPPEVGSDDPVLVAGRDVYARACAACHGSDGGGGAGQKLSDGAVIDAYPTIEDQIAYVAVGSNNMPGFGDRLSEEEQLAVARYVREVLAR